MVPRSETERLSTIGLRQKTSPMAREINALRVGLTAPLSSVLVRQLRQRLFRCSFPPQEATPHLTPALSRIRLQFSRQANQRHESMMDTRTLLRMSARMGARHKNLTRFLAFFKSLPTERKKEESFLPHSPNLRPNQIHETHYHLPLGQHRPFTGSPRFL